MALEPAVGSVAAIAEALVREQVLGSATGGAAELEEALMWPEAE